MHQNIDLIKPDFLLVEGYLINVNNICYITHKHLPHTSGAVIVTNADAFDDSSCIEVTVSTANLWDALVELRKP